MRMPPYRTVPMLFGPAEFCEQHRAIISAVLGVDGFGNEPLREGGGKRGPAGGEKAHRL